MMRQAPPELSPGSWLQFVEQSMQAPRLNPVAAGPARFHKVPPTMRHASPTDYHPLVFTFGPCHAKFEVPLSSYDLFKLQIAQALTSQQSFNNLLGAIQRRDGDIRKIYEVYLWELKFDIEPPLLANLLALDALTIVAAAFYHSKLDPVYNLVPAIFRDAMLLEQQLPLFILEAAIDSLVIPPDYMSLSDTEHFVQTLETSRPLYMKGLVNFYVLSTSIYPFQSRLQNLRWQDPSNHDQSMLSYIYRTFLTDVDLTAEEGVIIERGYEMPWIGGNCGRIPQQFLCCAQMRERESPPSETQSLSCVEIHRVATASKLRHCGIHFKVGQGGFTGIKFDAEKRVLTLPEIWVFDETKRCLLNLVAEEVLIPERDPNWPVASYIMMMDGLIDTEEDVKLLVEENVIHNMLGSHAELAAMWNTLALNLPGKYTPNDRMVSRNVSEASRQCVSKCWAGFHDTYFDRKPWLFISIIAAVCLFVLTFLQTTYTILQYKHQ